MLQHCSAGAYAFGDCLLAHDFRVAMLERHLACVGQLQITHLFSWRCDRSSGLRAPGYFRVQPVRALGSGFNWHCGACVCCWRFVSILVGCVPWTAPQRPAAMRERRAARGADPVSWESDSKSRSTMSHPAGARRFRVALSFPGEHRGRVEKIAEALAGRLGREAVLYDRWYGAEFNRPNLDVYQIGRAHV